MNDQFIQGVIFDWNKIDDDSYLKQIVSSRFCEKTDRIQHFCYWEPCFCGKGGKYFPFERGSVQ